MALREASASSNSFYTGKSATGHQALAASMPGHKSATSQPKVSMSASLGSTALDSRQSGLFGARPDVIAGNAGRAFNGSLMGQHAWTMSAAAVIASEGSAGASVKEQESPTISPESDYKIKHQFGLLDEDVLAQQTPSFVQSVKLEEFKTKLARLECMILRSMKDEAQVVARELAQRLYLSDDKQTALAEPMATPTQVQMASLLQAAPTEVQDAINVFRA